MSLLLDLALPLRQLLLPSDVIFNLIFPHAFDELSEGLVLGRVCRRMHQLVNMEPFWRPWIEKRKCLFVDYLLLKTNIPRTTLQFLFELPFDQYSAAPPFESATVAPAPAAIPQYLRYLLCLYQKHVENCYCAMTEFDEKEETPGLTINWSDSCILLSYNQDSPDYQDSKGCGAMNRQRTINRRYQIFVHQSGVREVRIPPRITNKIFCTDGLILSLDAVSVLYNYVPVVDHDLVFDAHNSVREYIISDQHGRQYISGEHWSFAGDRVFPCDTLKLADDPNAMRMMLSSETGTLVPFVKPVYSHQVLRIFNA